MTVRVKQLSRLKSQLTQLIDILDSLHPDVEVHMSPNTYQLFNFVGSSLGYINLDDLDSFVDEDEEYDDE
jgi:hypothetical protein